MKTKNWFSGKACSSLEETKQVLNPAVCWRVYFRLKSVKTDQVRTLSVESRQRSPHITKDRSHLLESMFQVSAAGRTKQCYKANLFFCCHFIFK